MLQIFPADEWMSIDALPFLGTLHFCVVLEGLFAKLISPVVWGQAGVDFTTNTSKGVMSKEIAL